MTSRHSASFIIGFFIPALATAGGVRPLAPLDIGTKSHVTVAIQALFSPPTAIWTEETLAPAIFKADQSPRMADPAFTESGERLYASILTTSLALQVEGIQQTQTNPQADPAELGQRLSSFVDGADRHYPVKDAVPTEFPRNPTTGWVTQAEYDQRMGRPRAGWTADKPATNVNIYDAMRFLNERSKAHSRTPYYEIISYEGHDGQLIVINVTVHPTADGYRFPTLDECRSDVCAMGSLFTWTLADTAGSRLYTVSGRSEVDDAGRRTVRTERRRLQGHPDVGILAVPNKTRP